MWKLIQIKHSKDDVHAVYSNGEKVCVHVYPFLPMANTGQMKTDDIPIEMPW